MSSIDPIAQGASSAYVYNDGVMSKVTALCYHVHKPNAISIQCQLHKGFSKGTVMRQNRTARRPIIGIPCARYADSWYTPANGNAISYLQAIEAAGGVPALIHHTNDPEVLATHYERCDGLIFAGGTDIDPSCYAAQPHPRLETPDPRQDALEITLARLAVADQKPIFGICRGIQLINVALGGTLHQDIPSVLAGTPQLHNHAASTEQRDMSFLAHPITLDRQSWLAAQLDADELVVNTLHHQALATISPMLQVVGRAPDGVVEAVEANPAEQLGFVLGVQCHPEELWNRTDSRWARVFANFVAACRS
jgi:putative glutamine amidotransferase